MEKTMDTIIAEIRKQITEAEVKPIEVDTASTNSMTHAMALILGRMGFSGHLCSVEKKMGYMCKKFQFKVDNRTMCEYKAYGEMDNIYNNFFDCVNTCLWVLSAEKYGLKSEDEIYRIKWLFSPYNGKERPNWEKLEK